MTAKRYSDRYQQLQRQDVDVEADKVPYPAPDWPLMQRLAQQTDDDWWVWVEENPEAWIRSTDAQSDVVDLEVWR